MISIEIVNPVVNIPDELKINGKVYLDVPKEFDIEEVISNLSVLSSGKSIIDAVFSLDVEFSRTNDLLLSQNINPDTLYQRFGFISCRVNSHGLPVYYDSIRVINQNDFERKYTNIDRDWVERIRVYILG